MMEILIYLSKSTLILSLFILIFELFIKRETLYTSARIFLLSGIFIALALPYLTIEKITFVNEYIESSLSEEVSSHAVYTEAAATEKADFWQLIPWFKVGFGIYFSVVAFFLFQFLFRLWQLQAFLKTERHFKFKNGIRYIQTKENTAPFSFFKNIVYNPDFHTDEELKLILKHEEAHATNLHSLDMILSNLLVFINWFNPLCWLYRKRIGENLEFLADREATDKLECISSYQLSLLNYVKLNHQAFPVNNFHKSFIRTRIKKLQQTSSKKYAGLKFTLILPLLLVFFLVFQIDSRAETIYIDESKQLSSDSKPSEEIDFSQKNSHKITLKKPVKKSTKVILVKTSTEKSLKEIQRLLKTQNVEFTYSDLEYDKDGYITQLNLSFTDQKGKDHTYSIFGEKPIPDIQLVISEDFTGFKTFTSSDKAISINRSSAIINNGQPASDIEEKLEKIFNLTAPSDKNTKKAIEMIGSVNVIKGENGTPIILINDQERTNSTEIKKVTKVFNVSKNTSAKQLEEIKRGLSRKNNFSIRSVKRNKEGKILLLKLKTKDKTGKSYDIKFENKQGISPFSIGLKNDQLFFN